MRKTFLTLGFGSLAAIALPLAASAQDDAPKMKRWDGHHMMMFEELDTDGNKAISRDEFVTHSADKFKKADTDGNGSISTAEFNAFMDEERKRRRQMMQDRMFKKMDANGDGQISREEMEAHAAKKFDRMDRNSDGQLNDQDHGRKGMMKDKKSGR